MMVAEGTIFESSEETNARIQEILDEGTRKTEQTVADRGTQSAPVAPGVDREPFKGTLFPARWGDGESYLAPCHRTYVKDMHIPGESTGRLIAPPKFCLGKSEMKRLNPRDACEFCELEKFLNGAIPETATPQLTEEEEKQIQTFLKSEPGEEDDIMEWCAECRNCDVEIATLIHGDRVVCLGSEKYRKYKGCLDIKIHWVNPDQRSTSGAHGGEAPRSLEPEKKDQAAIIDNGGK